MNNADKFFAYARERYQIFLNKEAGMPKPWTQDGILQSYRFCNIFREDDTVTKYFRQNVTKEKYGDKLVGATIMCRMINRPTTIQLMMDYEDDLLHSWATKPHNEWAADVKKCLKGVVPVINGAYIVSTAGGMNKLDGLLHCFKNVFVKAQEIQVEMEQEGCTLEHACELLQKFPHIGAFIAYEIVTDLRHTILKNAPDIFTWANPGPGAARGLGRVMGLSYDHFSRHSKRSVDEMMQHMQTLLAMSKDDSLWSQDYPFWEMREVEHTLCEFDKYERARLSEGTPKQQYKGWN